MSNPFFAAWKILKEQPPMSPDPRAGTDEMPYKTQPCAVCKQKMPYDGNSGSDICSPECEQIFRENRRSFQINEQQKTDKDAFLQTQLDRMRNINPEANYSDPR